MKTGRIDWAAVGGAWTILEQQVGPLDFTFSEENADRIASLIDGLLAQEGTSSWNPSLERFLDVLTAWTEAYESGLIPMTHADPLELLKHLMQSNGLRQADLADEFGGQSIVSAILSGKRRINLRQAMALGARFKVSPAAFLPIGVYEAVARLQTSSVDSRQLLQGINFGDDANAISAGSLAKMDFARAETFSSAASGVH